MIDRNAWLDFASPEQLAEARRLSDALHNATRKDKQKLIAEYAEFRRQTMAEVIRRRLQPDRPRPAEDRMQAAHAALERIQGDLPLNAWVPAGIVVQALRARHVDATAALWCLLDAVLDGRCQLAANRYQYPGDLAPDDLRLFGALEFSAQLEMAEEDPNSVAILDLPISSTTVPPPWAGLAIRFQSVGQSKYKTDASSSGNFGKPGHLNLAIDVTNHLVARNRKTADFAGNVIPWKLFVCMFKKAYNYASINHLFDVGWAEENVVNPETVQKHVSTIRKILKPLAVDIENKREVGYRLIDKKS